MKILITGNAGLLGSQMVDWLLENTTDNIIVGIDNLSGGYKENINDKIDNHYELDLATANLDNIFKEYNFDIVYHFAAYAAEGLSPFIRKFNYTNNLIATTNIINNCIKYNVKRLIFTSSMATYGRGILPFSEEQVPNPIDPYGVAKYACEMDIKIANEQHKLEYCIIRPHNVIGKKQNIWDKYRNVLGIWMYQHLNNLPLTIFGDGEQKRAFTVIDNILPCLWKAAISDKTKNQIINLGGLKEYTINEACDMLIRVMNGGTKKYCQARHEVKEAYCTFQKSIDLLDYKEELDLENGLKIMWDWAKQQPNRPRFEWTEYELDKNIYDYWRKND